MWSIAIDKWLIETNSTNHEKQNIELYNDCTIKFCESWKWQCHELKINQNFNQSTKHEINPENSCILTMWSKKSFKKNCQMTVFSSMTATITQKKWVEKKNFLI